MSITTTLTWTFPDSDTRDAFWTTLADRYGFTYSGASEAETLVLNQIKNEQSQAYSSRIGEDAGSSAMNAAFDAARTDSLSY